jgi:hypothetical protein
MMAISRRTLRAGVATLACLGFAGAGVGGAPKPDTITEASIRAHMEFLASDAMNGRGSGTHDEWVAATYIGSQMRAWGIEPLGDAGAFVQQVETTRLQSATPPVLVVPGARFTTGKEMTAQALSRGAAAGPLHHYTPGTPAPRDAFVVVPAGATPQPAELAAAAGVITAQTAAAAGRGGRGGGGQGPAQLWRLSLTKDAFDNVAAMADGTAVTVDADVKAGSTWNALGQLKGSDPRMADEVILLTAHLDHLGVRGTGPDTIYNGADDDASGSTAVLELAEALAKGPRPKRTVVFAWFGSEEAGGFGARHFLEVPPVPLDHIVANLEFEMLGRPDEKVPPHTLWLTGYERSDLGPRLAREGARIVQDPHPDQNFFMRSDNIQLARKGIVAQTVSSFNLHTDYHHPSDDLSHIDFAHMTESIQSMLAPVLWLTNSTFRPTWVKGMCPEPCKEQR